MSAIILSIGDELVLGQTVDTNSAWLSRELAKVGCPVLAHTTVGDDQAAIEQTIRQSAARCRYLVISGGIGPTADDLTRQALAAVMGAPLELNADWLSRLHDFFQARGRPMPRLNEIQAMIPRGAAIIDNTCGTAAGMRAPITIDGNACDVFVMPGVPKEMMAMFRLSVLPAIGQAGGGAVILSRVLHTFGLGESAVAEKLGLLMDRSRNPSVGTTVSGGIVSLRINARFANAEEARRQIESTERACREALGDLVFGTDEQTLPEEVAKLLRTSTKTVATAESCTGGLLAKMLTDIPGSSTYFRQGWVTYSNESKTSLLGVPPETIERFGAVSEPVVAAMAEGAARRAAVDYALAISGIAGPDGGTEAKPVGTVCIGLAHRTGEVVIVSRNTFHLFGDREMVRDRACKMALMMLRYAMNGRDMPV